MKALAGEIGVSDRLVIRRGDNGDVRAIAAIELDAFISWASGCGYTGEGVATPAYIVEQAIATSLVWVADIDGMAVGFLAGCDQDNLLHIHEVDVLRRWQKKGIGRRLMQAAIVEARERGMSGLSLTTDRFIPFNAPFYKTLGFCEVASENLSPFLRAILEGDIAHGLSPERRLAMTLLFADEGR